MVIQRIVAHINKDILWPIRRFENRIRKRNFDRSGISVLSQNCTGGIVMKSFNMPFLTPTVNMYLTMPDFIRLCKNIDYYFGQNHILLPELTAERGYIVTRLGDITIFGVHFHDFNDFCLAWERRKVRLNKNKLFLIFTDRDGFTPDMLDEINTIPYPKVLFSYRQFDGYDFIVKVPKDKELNCCCSVTDFWKLTGVHICEWFFDFPRAFNRLA